MKKFSWIFALILALSIGFIGCPAADDDDGGGGGGGGGYTGPTKVITFGTGDGQVAVLKDGQNDSGPYDPGTLTYLADNTGFKYTYGAGGNYGNSILRFKVDLGGDVALGAYKAVQFDWQAEGFKDDNDPAVSNKKLFLLATKTEDELKPYKSDAVPGVAGASLVPLIISTDYFDNSPHPAWAEGDPVIGKDPDKLYANALQPTVNGTNKVTVTLPIVKSTSFLGEVWFAIYVHASSGSYTISNFRFGADPSTGTDYGTDAPNKPVVAGDPNAWFYLDLSKITTVGTTGVSGGTVANTDKSYTAGVLTATFGNNPNGKGERLVIDLTDDQLTALKARTGNHLNIYIKGRLVSTDGTDGVSGDFRYSIADATAGSDWAVWHPVGPGKFEAILSATNVAYANQGAEPKHFILQHQDTTHDVIEITSIRIEFENSVAGEITASSADKGYYQVAFADGDVKGRAGTVVVDADGTNFTYTSTTDSYERAWAYFPVTLPTGYKLSNYKYITYKIKGAAGATDEGGYKGFIINAYPTEDAIDAITSGSQLPTEDQIAGGGWQATGIENLGTEYTRTVNVGTLPDGTDLNSVWIAVRVGAKQGFIFTLKDLKFY
ncbi:hypothetical protein [Treponema sp. R6D11]